MASHSRARVPPPTEPEREPQRSETGTAAGAGGSVSGRGAAYVERDLREPLTVSRLQVMKQRYFVDESEGEGGVKINFKSQLVGYRYIDDAENSGGRR